MQRQPTAAGQLLIALDMWLGPMRELALTGGTNESENNAALAEIRTRYLPNSVFAYRLADPPSPIHSSRLLDTLFAGRTAMGDQPMLFICENFTCQAPLVGVEAIRRGVAGL
jgi:uncharacterized protein YyaL (SSP411 family)